MFIKPNLKSSSRDRAQSPWENVIVIILKYISYVQKSLAPNLPRICKVLLPFSSILQHLFYFTRENNDLLTAAPSEQLYSSSKFLLISLTLHANHCGTSPEDTLIEVSTCNKFDWAPVTWPR